jgi:hypothetical protein
MGSTRPRQGPQQPVLFTARYGNPNLVHSPLAKVGITVYPPRWRLPYHVTARERRLAPTGWLFRENDQQRFVKGYVERLVQLDPTPAEILTALDGATGRNGLALLCFEDLRREGSWCHRRVLAAWLERQYGWVVPELEEVALETNRQPALPGLGLS